MLTRVMFALTAAGAVCPAAVISTVSCSLGSSDSYSHQQTITGSQPASCSDQHTLLLNGTLPLTGRVSASTAGNTPLDVSATVTALGVFSTGGSITGSGSASIIATDMIYTFGPTRPGWLRLTPGLIWGSIDGFTAASVSVGGYGFSGTEGESSVRCTGCESRVNNLFPITLGTVLPIRSSAQVFGDGDFFSTLLGDTAQARMSITFYEADQTTPVGWASVPEPCLAWPFGAVLFASYVGFVRRRRPLRR